jgi:hypothetical protein
LGHGDSCKLLFLYSELNGSGDLVDKSIYKGVTLHWIVGVGIGMFGIVVGWKCNGRVACKGV